MSESIKNEIERIETTKAGVLAQLKRSELAAEHTYNNMIRVLQNKCKHEPELSTRFGIPMTFCKFCGADLR